MTIPTLDPILPISPQPYSLRPYNGMRPFVYVFGRSALDTIEDLRLYVRKAIEHLNDESIALNTSLVAVIGALIEAFNGKISEIEDALTEQTDANDAKIAELIADVNAAVESVVNSSIELQDPVLAAIANDPASLFSQFAAATWALKPRTGTRSVGQGELVVSVADFGATGTGTDDTEAITAALASLTTKLGTDNVAGVLYFPAGRYVDSVNRVIPVDRRVVFKGAGKYLTEIRRANGSTGDYLTFNANYSGVQDIAIDGRRYQNQPLDAYPGAGDNIVLNGAYSQAINVLSNKAQGNGITIGKSAAAVAHTLTDVQVRECRGYGIQVASGFGSTDGMWKGVEVGMTGKSCVRLDTGSQNISDLHTWQGGLADPVDAHGIFVNSQSNLFAVVQAETCNGKGIYVTSGRNIFGVGRVWGNMKMGIHVLNTTRVSFSEVQAYRNAGENAAVGAVSDAFAGYVIENSQRVRVSNVTIYDDNAVVPVYNYQTVPEIPFPGRMAALSQAYAIAEIGTADYNTYTGVIGEKADTRGNGGPTLFVGNNNRYAGNQWGAPATIPTQVVSANAVRVPFTADAIYVNSGATITSVLGHLPGRRVTLIFNGAGSGSVTDNNGTLNLNGTFNPVPGATLTLVSDGSNWIETGRTTPA